MHHNEARGARGDAAVVTLPGSFNYGNLLQKYAVQHALRTRGFEPVTLEFRDVSLSRRVKDFVKSRILGRQIVSADSLVTPERRGRFSSFKSLISLREVTGTTAGDVGGYDWYLAGSDQIWNPEHLDVFRSPFLPFAPEGRRIALSASFGVSALPDERVAEYRRALGGFTRISVREDAGADIVESLTGCRPPVLCDPTLAVPRGEWERLANDSLNPAGPYVFAYLLGDDAWRADMPGSLADRYGAEVVRISDRDDGSQLAAGSAEFVALIAGARHVVTDSFHCALFAAMLERPLTVIRRNYAGPSMSSRLETLSAKLGLEGKVVAGGSPDLDAAADYEGLAWRVAAERTAFDAYLDDALGVL